MKGLLELIRTANALIDPEDSISYLQKKDIVDKLRGDKPKCFLTLKGIGQDTSDYHLPICNRNGIEDPKVINVSLQAVKKMMDSGSEKFDVNVMNTMLNKLQHKHNTLSKAIPKPAGAAAKKAKITSAVADTGLYSSTKGSVIYAVIKGAVDAGLDIPHSPKVFPSDERLQGQHTKSKTLLKEIEAVKKKIGA